MTKRKGKTNKRSHSQKRVDTVINRAESLLEDERIDEAISLLRQHADRFPSDLEVLNLWMHLSYEDGNGIEMWDVARRLYKIDPTNVEHVIDLFNACMQIPMPFMALHLADIHSQQLRDHEDFGEAFATYYTVLMALRDQMMNQPDKKEGLTTTHMVNIEELRSLYLIGAFDEAKSFAAKLWNDFPDPNLLGLTMAQGYFTQGDFAEAARLAQQAYEGDPSDFEALTNLIIYTFRDGKLDDSSALMQALRSKTELESGYELSLALEVWAWLGDNAKVTQLFEQHHDLPEIEHSMMINHLAAASYLFLGEEKQAKKLWRKTLKINPNMEIAKENLADLNLPVGTRHGPWHFQVTEWIPTTWMEKVFKALAARTETQGERNLRKFYDSTPALQFILPHIFEKGSDISVEFAIQIAALLKLPILAAFALGQRGSDELRVQAANLAAQYGLLPRGQPTQLYIKGELDDVILMAYRVHSEGDPKPPPRAIRNLLQDSYNLIQHERYDSAMTLVQDGLEKVPDDPTLLNYLATLHRAKGQRREEEAVIRHTFAVHPDYFFGRCGMIEVYAREGNFDAADALLEPMLAREGFHFSEFGVFCKAHVVLLAAKGDFKSAHSWLDMWEGIHPNLVEVKKIRDEVNRAERDAARQNN